MSRFHKNDTATMLFLLIMKYAGSLKYEGIYSRSDKKRNILADLMY